MKKTVYLIALFLAFATISEPAWAQRNRKNATPQSNNATTMVEEIRRFPILGLGKAYTDRISLRWTAGDADIMRALLHDGVLIDRLRIGADNNAIGGWERVSPDTIRAWSIKQFESRVTEKDTALLIIAQSIYGKPEYPAETTLNIVEMAKMQQMERENRLLTINLYTALSEEAALASGLAYNDRIAVDSAVNYVYKIFPATIKPHTVVPDTGYVFVAGIDVNRHPKYQGVEAVSRDGAVLVQWPVDPPDFTGYFIEKSDDGRVFRRLNEVIYIPSIDTTFAQPTYSYLDSVPNGKNFHYRIVGVTPFGERIRFENVAVGKGIDLTPPAAPFLSQTEINGRVTLSWKKPTEPDLLGYHIVRGVDAQRVDTILTADKILPPNTLSYSFNKTDAGHSTFYRLMVMDNSHNASFSDPVYIFTVDSIPPLAPHIVSGKIDSTGVVTLHWAHLKNEPDLRGYKVLFANAADHNFAPVSDIIPDTTYVFETTLNTLTPELFVKVIAIDANYNHGEPSAAFRLVRPDTIPPRTPVILGYENMPSGIRIRWSPSVDLAPDRFIVFRKLSNISDWSPIAETKEVMFNDSAVAPRQMYEYSLVEIDAAGNRSQMAFPLTVVSSTLPAENIRLTNTYQSQQESVRLTWTKPARKVSAVIIYKDEGKGLMMYDRVSSDTPEFTEQAKPGAQYGIRIIYADGTESEVIRE